MIYIASHKYFIAPQKEGYIPLQVGAAMKDDLGFLKDSVGDSISEKNANYCELTGLYWIWKNTDDPYKGLVHYRRFFASTELISSYKVVYSLEQLESFLSESDIVLPEKEYYKTTAKTAMIDGCTTEEVFTQLRDSVQRIYPDYLEDFDSFFNNNCGSQYNMMFCRKEIFDSYCSWLFNILFDLEKYVDLNKLNDIQRRVYGYLSERLLNIWVFHNELKVKYVNTIQMELPLWKKIQIIRRRWTNKPRFFIKRMITSRLD